MLKKKKEKEEMTVQISCWGLFTDLIKSPQGPFEVLTHTAA